MGCELGIPVARFGLYPVETDLGSMALELTARTPTDTPPDTKKCCAIKAAIRAHLVAKGFIPDLPDSFTLQQLCRRCGDEVTFSAE